MSLSSQPASTANMTASPGGVPSPDFGNFNTSRKHLASNELYLGLARQKLALPIGADLVLSEKSERESIKLDGQKLGEVVIETARRYGSPLAFPLMDLSIEKAELLAALGIQGKDAESFHFSEAPGREIFSKVESLNLLPLTPALKAALGAVERVSREPDLVPVGMVIGPFSLATKLLSDPITAAYLAGSGIDAAEDKEVETLLSVLELSMKTVERSVRMLAASGVKAICVCEPAANSVFISPNQMEAGSDVFEKLVLSANRKIKMVMDEVGVDLILHDCGQLSDQMIKSLASLEPVIFSVGSSRPLWEVANLVPETTVLFGNLPSKKFYSDKEISVERVKELSKEIIQKMKENGHPFILGSECDVLAVAGSEETIKAKVSAMVKSITDG